MGIAPTVEIAQTDDTGMQGLISEDSPWFYLVDYRYLVFEQIQETAIRLPTAPGLTNHITMDVRNRTQISDTSGNAQAGSLGWDL